MGEHPLNARLSHSAVLSSVIGIDASRAVTGAPTGTEYYSRALIDAMLRLDSRARFRLYTRTNPPYGFFPPTNNYEIRSIPFPRLWTHVRLASEMLTHTPDALFVPAHVLPAIHPPHSLVTVHDLGFKFFPQTHPFFQRLYLDWSTRWNVKAAEVVIADSYATRDDLVRVYRAESSQIRVVYPSYNADIFNPVTDPREMERVKSKYSLGEPYLLSVGTLHPRKNYARLIEAYAALPPGYLLVIVGKRGWMFDSIHAQALKLGLHRRVVFLDYVPLEDMPALYAGSALTVLPSLYEGFGFPVLEAQACESPLVCSNSSSLPEVAGEGAIYFDPLNVAEMSGALRLALEDASLRRDVVRHGRENVRRFSWESAAKRVLEILGAR